MFKRETNNEIKYMRNNVSASFEKEFDSQLDSLGLT